VPFFFIRVDEAGNVSKRLDSAGFPFARHGGGCPLWNVHHAFRTPREIVTQWLELPDGERFFSIARTVTAGGGGFGRPRVDRAVALGCAAEHAGKLIYTQDRPAPEPTPDRHHLPPVPTRRMHRPLGPADRPPDPAGRYSPDQCAVRVFG